MNKVFSKYTCSIAIELKGPVPKYESKPAGTMKSNDLVNHGMFLWIKKQSSKKKDKLLSEF